MCRDKASGPPGAGGDRKASTPMSEASTSAVN